jgi:hypothetical protein
MWRGGGWLPPSSCKKRGSSGVRSVRASAHATAGVARVASMVYQREDGSKARMEGVCGVWRCRTGTWGEAWEC